MLLVTEEGRLIQQGSQRTLLGALMPLFTMRCLPLAGQAEAELCRQDHLLGLRCHERWRQPRNQFLGREKLIGRPLAIPRRTSRSSSSKLYLWVPARMLRKNCGAVVS
jgi:hypothetical protein